jgi:hypothetical protein
MFLELIISVIVYGLFFRFKVVVWGQGITMLGLELVCCLIFLAKIIAFNHIFVRVVITNLSLKKLCDDFLVVIS